MWGHFVARGQIDTGPVRAALTGPAQLPVQGPCGPCILLLAGQYSGVKQARDRTVAHNVLAPVPHSEPACCLSRVTCEDSFFTHCHKMLTERDRSVQFSKYVKTGKKFTAVTNFYLTFGFKVPKRKFFSVFLRPCMIFSQLSPIMSVPAIHKKTMHNHIWPCLCCRIYLVNFFHFNHYLRLYMGRC